MKILDTDRITLSALTLEDAEFYLALVNDRTWIANIKDKGIRTIEAAREAIQKDAIASQNTYGFSLFVVRRKSDNVEMGLCGLIKRDGLKNVDLGYAFLPAYVGQGYAFEAASAVVRHAKSAVGLKKLAAITSPNNERSNHLLEKLGFTLEDVIVMPGEEHQTNLYGLEFTL
jgi:RimJ/RimL family protein N-acetyltransferase